VKPFRSENTSLSQCGKCITLRAAGSNKVPKIQLLGAVVKYHLINVAIVASAISSPVLAADMPPAPTPPVYQPAAVAPPPPLFSWTGVYIGVNAGYGFAHASSSFAFSGGLLGGVSGTGTADLNGGIAGGQIGFNWQSGMAVFGIELDGQWSGQQQTTTTVCGFGCSLSEVVKIKSFATARARLGVDLSGIMFYVTGGGAWTAASDEVSATAGGVTANIVSLSSSKVGWTVGGGVEVMFAGNWSTKVEYLYIDTNNLTATAIPAFFGGSVTETARLRDNIVRVGLNYRFGPSAVTARY
jgi:outer membrane immunogenic protein